MNKSTLKTAIVQHPPVFLNLDHSISAAENYILEAAANGAEIIAFPETWLPGYPVWIDSAPGAALWGAKPAKTIYRLLADNSLQIPSPQFDKLRAIASQSGAHLFMGVNEKSGGTLYNTILYMNGNGIDYAIHRKLVPTYTERMIWGRGDGSTLCLLPNESVNIGGLICWEHWMPLARAAMHSLNEAIHIAQWPSVHDLHLLASRHYAFEGGCFVLAAGSVLSKGEAIAGVKSLAHPPAAALELLDSIPGEAEKLLQTGGSVVIAPDSGLLEEPVFDQPGIVYNDIDLARIAEAKLLLDTDGHYSRPDVFNLSVNREKQNNVTFEP